MDFKFESISHKRLFEVICDRIKSGNYYLEMPKDRFGGKVKVLIREKEINIDIQLNSVYKDSDESPFTYEAHDCRWYVYLKKIEPYFGNTLIKMNYHYRGVPPSKHPDISKADVLTHHVVNLLNTITPLNEKPSYITQPTTEEKNAFFDTRY